MREDQREPGLGWRCTRTCRRQMKGSIGAEKNGEGKPSPRAEKRQKERKTKQQSRNSQRPAHRLQAAGCPDRYPKSSRQCHEERVEKRQACAREPGTSNAAG